jgi:hypothetical protein
MPVESTDPNERGDRDRDAVAAGMELLRWEITADSDPVIVASQVRREGPDVLILIVLLALAWVGSGLVIFNYVASATSWMVFLTVAVIGLVLGGVGLLYRRLRPDPARHERAVASASVVLTSTGVLVGNEARLWHAGDYRLRSVKTARNQLVLDFGARGALEIPIPGRLARDIEEMAQMLEARTGPLDPDMLPEDSPRPK